MVTIYGWAMGGGHGEQKKKGKIDHSLLENNPDNLK